MVKVLAMMHLCNTISELAYGMFVSQVARAVNNEQVVAHGPTQRGLSNINLGVLELRRLKAVRLCT